MEITCPGMMAWPRGTKYATKLLPLLLLLALPAMVQAQFNYTIDNGTITITGYTGSGGGVVIPDTINGLPVTGIGRRAFYGQPFVTSVVVPNSVTSIGAGAFWMQQPNQRHDPGQRHQHRGYAFSACTSLTSVTIPNSVTSIGARRSLNAPA